MKQITKRREENRNKIKTEHKNKGHEGRNERIKNIHRSLKM
jgi:hypothetical protein